MEGSWGARRQENEFGKGVFDDAPEYVRFMAAEIGPF